MYDPDARVSATQAADMAGVSRHVIAWWRSAGHLSPVAQRGRSPLYRLGDVIDLDRSMRASSRSHRSAARAA